MPQPAALWPSPRNVLRQQLTIFSTMYYQVLLATHLPTPEGWKAELAWVPRVQLTCPQGYYSTAILAELKPVKSESLVQVLTTTLPSEWSGAWDLVMTVYVSGHHIGGGGVENTGLFPIGWETVGKSPKGVHWSRYRWRHMTRWRDCWYHNLSNASLPRVLVGIRWSFSVRMSYIVRLYGPHR